MFRAFDKKGRDLSRKNAGGPEFKARHMFAKKRLPLSKATLKRKSTFGRSNFGQSAHFDQSRRKPREKMPQ